MFSGPAGTSHLAPNRCPSRAGWHSGRRSVITYRTDSPRGTAAKDRPGISWFTGHSAITRARPTTSPEGGVPGQTPFLSVRNQHPASTRAGSSPRRDIGVRVIACCMLADVRSATTPGVNDHCVGGGRGRAGTSGPRSAGTGWPAGPRIRRDGPPAAAPGARLGRRPRPAVPGSAELQLRPVPLGLGDEAGVPAAEALVELSTDPTRPRPRRPAESRARTGRGHNPPARLVHPSKGAAFP